MRRSGLDHIAALELQRPYRVLLLGDSHFERFPREAHGASAFAALEAVVGRTFVAGVGGDAACHLAWRLSEQRLLDFFLTPLEAAVPRVLGHGVSVPRERGPPRRRRSRHPDPRDDRFC